MQEQAPARRRAHRPRASRPSSRGRGTAAGLGHSLQSNAKALEGRQHADRDAQFHYLNERVRRSLAAGTAVISVDTKRKELVGRFKNAGREWRRQGEPERVNVHDFVDPTLGKAIPHGVYDLAADSGSVNVGTDHDTGAFAVGSNRPWWQQVGQPV